MASGEIHEPRKGPSGLVWLGLTMLFVAMVLAAVVLPNVMMNRMMRSAKPATSSQLEAAVAGQGVNLVAQLTAIGSDGQMHGELLASQARGVYARTGAAVLIRRDAATKTVMGKPSDLLPGALIALQGTVTGHDSGVAAIVRSQRIVVLTGYATVH